MVSRLGSKSRRKTYFPDVRRKLEVINSAVVVAEGSPTRTSARRKRDAAIADGPSIVVRKNTHVRMTTKKRKLSNPTLIDEDVRMADVFAYNTSSVVKKRTRSAGPAVNMRKRFQQRMRNIIVCDNEAGDIYVPFLFPLSGPISPNPLMPKTPLSLPFAVPMLSPEQRCNLVPVCAQTSREMPRMAYPQEQLHVDLHPPMPDPDAMDVDVKVPVDTLIPSLVKRIVAKTNRTVSTPKSRVRGAAHVPACSDQPAIAYIRVQRPQQYTPEPRDGPLMIPGELCGHMATVMAEEDYMDIDDEDVVMADAFADDDDSWSFLATPTKEPVAMPLIVISPVIPNNGSKDVRVDLMRLSPLPPSSKLVIEPMLPLPATPPQLVHSVLSPVSLEATRHITKTSCSEDFATGLPALLLSSHSKSSNAHVVSVDTLATDAKDNSSDVDSPGPETPSARIIWNYREAHIVDLEDLDDALVIPPSPTILESRIASPVRNDSLVSLAGLLDKWSCEDSSLAMPAPFLDSLVDTPISAMEEDASDYRGVPPLSRTSSSEPSGFEESFTMIDVIDSRASFARVQSPFARFVTPPCTMRLKATRGSASSSPFLDKVNPRSVQQNRNMPGHLSIDDKGHSFELSSLLLLLDFICGVCFFWASLHILRNIAPIVTL